MSRVGRAFRTIGYLPVMTSTEVIEQIGRRLARAAPANSRVVLFGSHARGNADADADFDVLVIEPTVGDAIQEAVRLRRELDELDVPIDLIVMDEAKAEQRALERGTMVAHALREGRLLAQT
jgi:predicted nucleotidyltransferase